MGCYFLAPVLGSLGWGIVLAGQGTVNLLDGHLLVGHVVVHLYPGGHFHLFQVGHGMLHLPLGCLIPPLLLQTYFASISFGHL